MYLRRKELIMTKKGIMVIIALAISFIVLILGVALDQRVQTILGIMAIISGWVALAICGFLMLDCLCSDPFKLLKD
jgi:ABC-type microcin C transport system permease subunit YejE